MRLRGHPHAEALLVSCLQHAHSHRLIEPEHLQPDEAQEAPSSQESQQFVEREWDAEVAEGEAESEEDAEDENSEATEVGVDCGVGLPLSFALRYVVGLESKKPSGCREKEARTTGMIGKSYKKLSSENMDVRLSYLAQPQPLLRRSPGRPKFSVAQYSLTSNLGMCSTPIVYHTTRG